MELSQLKPGRRFRVSGMEKTGVVVRQGIGSTIVAFDRKAKFVEFERETPNGTQHVRFAAKRNRTTAISPGTEVEPL